MSEWDDRIRNHAVWEELRLLGPAIDSAVALEGIDERSLAGLERVRAALAYCGKRLAGTDPLTALPTPLDGIAASLRAARGHVEQFLTEHTLAHVEAASAQIDVALGHASQIPGPATTEELGALIAVATEYRATLERNLAAARQTAGEASAATAQLQHDLAELSKAVPEEQQRITQLAAEFQQKFAETQEQRTNQFTETLLTTQQELNKITGEHQAQFSAAEESRRNEFTQTQTARQQTVDAISADYNKRLSEQDVESRKQREVLAVKHAETLDGLTKEYSERGNAIIREVEEHKARIEQLVGVIGNLGVTSGYLTTANHARKTMWLWQAITVAAMAGLVFFAYRTLGLLEDSNGTFHWGMFAGRVFLLASLGVLAAYAASQADKFFEMERRNRKLALELEAIGPYLAPLSQEEQDKFRIQMGDRTFGQDDLPGTTTKSPASLLDLLNSKEGKQLIELIREVIKKG